MFKHVGSIYKDTFVVFHKDRPCLANALFLRGCTRCSEQLRQKYEGNRDIKLFQIPRSTSFGICITTGLELWPRAVQKSVADTTKTEQSCLRLVTSICIFSIREYCTRMVRTLPRVCASLPAPPNCETQSSLRTKKYVINKHTPFLLLVCAPLPAQPPC